MLKKFKIHNSDVRPENSVPREFRINLGQSLIELLVAIGITAIFLPAIFSAIIASREGKPQQNQRLAAIALSREAAEAARSIREKDWTNIAPTGTYHPVVSGSTWSLGPGSETIGNFTRKIDIFDVHRNPPLTGPIVENGGVIDPSTKKIEVTVSWNTPFASSVQLPIYFSRYKNVTEIDDTSDASQFGGGTNIDTVVTTIDDGEVILGSGGGGNWCDPSLSIPGQDLPRQGVAHAITAKVVDGSQNRAFVGTGINASGVSFANVSVTNVPLGQIPNATVLGEFDAYKTNDVFGEDNYAYLATDDNQEEVVIVNLTSVNQKGKYSKAGSFNVPGNVDGNSVYVVGNVGYVAAGSKLYNFDLSLDRSTATIKDPDGVTLDGTGIKMAVVGNYAYVAIGGSSNKLNIINVGTDPNNMALEGRLSIAGAGDGQSLFVNNPSGTRAYLVTAASATDEFYVVDTSNKSAPFVRGSFDTAGMDPKGVTVVPGNVAIVVGTGGTEQYLVLRYSDSSSQTTLQRCGGLTMTGGIGINGIASVLEGDGQAFSYIVTTDASQEFRMIEGGPGLSSFTGTFESRTFDAAIASAAFNKFTASVNQPNATSIKFKVAVAAQNQGTGDCTGVPFSFVGPTGDPIVDDYFENVGAVGSFFLTGSIPFVANGGYQNPGRCFRYRAYFSTPDVTLTPILYDIKINYSL